MRGRIAPQENRPYENICFLVQRILDGYRPGGKSSSVEQLLILHSELVRCSGIRPELFEPLPHDDYALFKVFVRDILKQKCGDQHQPIDSERLQQIRLRVVYLRSVTSDYIKY